MVFNLFENTSEKAEELGFEVFKEIYYQVVIEYMRI